MDLLESLDAEVSALVNQMQPEVILALMDKWDEEIEAAWKANKASIPDLLNHYVRLKVAWHHVKRHMEWEWSHDMTSRFEQQERYYLSRITEARRKYYDARIRFEGNEQHHEHCPCRGCRCLKGIARPSEVPRSGLAGGTGSIQAGGYAGQGASQAPGVQERS